MECIYTMFLDHTYYMIYGKRYTVLPPETGANFSYTNRLISVKPHGKFPPERGGGTSICETPSAHPKSIGETSAGRADGGSCERWCGIFFSFMIFYVGVFLDRPFFFWKHGPGVGQVFFFLIRWNMRGVWICLKMGEVGLWFFWFWGVPCCSRKPSICMESKVVPSSKKAT